MQAFLRVSAWIDALSRQLGKLAALAVLAAALISAANAFARFGFSASSNAWLEIQWYLFAATVMLGAPMVLWLNEHVRVDIVYSRLQGRAPVLVDLFGLVFFLLPVMALIAYLSAPLFIGMWRSGEVSGSAGGLVRWPVMLLLPLGFAMLALQGVSEVIKRLAFLRGLIHMDLHYEKPLQ